MIRSAVAASLALPVGLAPVCNELGISRSTLYAQKAALGRPGPSAKRGPKPLVADGELLPAIRSVLTDPPFLGEGYRKVHARLRHAGIRAEMYLGNPKNNLGVQFKYADRRHSPCVVIQGGDEKARGEIQIKDLVLGAEIAGLSKDRDDYLAKQAEAQFAAPEGDLVAAVRKVLARHGVTWE